MRDLHIKRIMDVGVPKFTGYPYVFFCHGRAGVGSAAGPTRLIRQNHLANALSFVFQHGSQIC